MKRRSFMLGAIAACGYFFTKDVSANMKFSEKMFGFKTMLRTQDLATNQAIIVKPNTVYQMPKNPKNGDYVQIVVDQSSLLKPSSLTCDLSKVKIIGERESLVLDSLAIVKLTYDSREKNWKHT